VQTLRHALFTVAFFIKTTQTVYQLKNNEVTVASISLVDEVVILLIFVNNKLFCLHSHNGKGVACGQNGNADAA